MCYFWYKRGCISVYGRYRCLWRSIFCYIAIIFCFAFMYCCHPKTRFHQWVPYSDHCCQHFLTVRIVQDMTYFSYWLTSPLYASLLRNYVQRHPVGYTFSNKSVTSLLVYPFVYPRNWLQRQREKLKRFQMLSGYTMYSTQSHSINARYNWSYLSFAWKLNPLHTECKWICVKNFEIIELFFDRALFYVLRVL